MTDAVTPPRPKKGYGFDLPLEQQRTKHAVIDGWRDVVIVCRCGQHFAAKTRKRAMTEYREHKEGA